MGQIYKSKKYNCKSTVSKILECNHMNLMLLLYRRSNGPCEHVKSKIIFTLSCLIIFYLVLFIITCDDWPSLEPTLLISLGFGCVFPLPKLAGQLEHFSDTWTLKGLMFFFFLLLFSDLWKFRWSTVVSLLVMGS